jgi:hypothetical protein
MTMKPDEKCISFRVFSGGWNIGFYWQWPYHYIDTLGGDRADTWLSIGRLKESGMVVFVIGPIFIGIFHKLDTQ